MKLISLNTWGGKIYKPLVNFLQQHSNDTDIFCFQEVFKTSSDVKVRYERRMNLFKDVSKILINHQGYYCPTIKDYAIFSRTKVYRTNFSLYFGLAIFVKREIKVDDSGDFFIYGKRYIFNPNDLNTLPKNAQYLTFTNSGKKFTICNLHGIWRKDGKDDSPSRLEQSRKLNKFLNKQVGEKILCGDLNLDINTKSIEILEENLANLIKKHNIKTTRNENFPGNEKFADYMFVSKGINVLTFQVPNIEISDHLPMILEFS